MIKLQAFSQRLVFANLICANLCTTVTSVILLCLQDKVAKAQEVKDVAMSSLAQAIEDENKEQWRAEGRSMLFDAKRVSNVFVSLFIIFCFIFKQQTILTACGFQPALTLNLERHHYVHFYVYRPLLATSANSCSNNNNTEKKETCRGYYKLNKMSLDQQ